MNYLKSESFKRKYKDDEKVAWIVDSYKEYLDGFLKPIKDLLEKKGFPAYDKSNRFVHMQFLLLVQKQLFDRLIKMPIQRREFVLEDLAIDNNGGRNTLPSIAFWMGNQNKDTKAVFESSYFSIDGVTPKMGINYFRGQKQSAEALAKDFDELMSNWESLKNLNVVANERKMKFHDGDIVNPGQKSVSSIKTFTITIESDRELVLDGIADLIVDFFNMTHRHSNL